MRIALVANRPVGWAYLGSSQVALEQSLLSLAAPEAPVLTRLPSLDHPVINSDTYKSWRRLRGTQVMHLVGLDPQATTEAAEQSSIDWTRRQQSIGNHYPRSFLFRFCTYDPLRNSVTALLTACILHFFRASPGMVELNQALLQDQYKLQNAWTDEDLCNKVLSSYAWMQENSPLVLLGLDGCDARSRKRFWRLIGEIASRTEEDVKIIVTASKPGTYTAATLREELKEWPEVNILEWEVTAEEPRIDADPKTEMRALLARLCPSHFGHSKVHSALQRLQPMHPKTLSSVLDLLETYSKWPAEESKDNLTAFLDAMDLIEPSYTPHEAAWAILGQSARDKDLCMNALPWILGSQRPLTLEELAGIVAFSKSLEDEQLGPPEAEDVERCLRELGGQFRGLASLDGGHFRIRSDVAELLADDSTEDLEQVRKRAPALTANMLLHYLELAATQERLHSLFQQYENQIRKSGDAVTPPVTSDGKDVLFYAVYALPHHLSSIQVPGDVESQMRDPSGPYDAWSKVFWAMSNPFSRAPRGPLESAWSTWESTPEFGPPSMVRLRERRPPLESLAQAVRANNEDMALILAEESISNLEYHQRSLNKEEEEQTLTFPPPILWRAAWLDMDRLLALLLCHSKQQDDSSSATYPSMLYLACATGSPKSVRVLLNHGADIRVKAEGSRTPLYTACMRGHVNIIQSLVDKDRSLLAWPQPETPLSRASTWGCWRAVEVLLAMGADPNQPEKEPMLAGDSDPPGDKWFPITITSSVGHRNTTRILLDHGADPNTIGAYGGVDTCLWFAALEGESVDTMKELLDHGSDPNHKNLKPPLLIEIIEDTQMPEDTKFGMFELLLGNDPRVDVNRADEDGKTPLIVAAEVGSQFAVHWLLENGASVNAVDSGNHTALYLAIAEEKWDVVHQLLGHREKSRLDLVCSHGDTQLQLAMGNIDELRNLLEAGSDAEFVNKRHQALLNCAVAEEKTAVVKMLLLEYPRNVDVHHRDQAGWSPIMDATGDVPNPEIARMLMEAGASLADTTTTGYSPLHLAAWKKRPDVLRVLLEFHEVEDLARRSLQGETPLLSVHGFTIHETFDCMRLLVRAGSDINSQDCDGETLLIRSAGVGWGGRAVHKWLLTRPKIDIHLRSRAYGTALHVACMYGDDGLVSMLLQKGADANSENESIRSTPLIAACMPCRRYDTENPQSRMESVEGIVRALVAKGADVSLTSGITIFNALCAAALSAGVGTINFVLDKSASTFTPDPLGRLPIHFAAANGIRNFEAVALVYGDDIMIPDKFGKNVLHWAAQVGNAETVKAILEKLSSPTNKNRYVNLEDADGWTPLAWASRTAAHDIGPFWARSEPQNYKATIQQLVDNGGDILVRFRMGRGDEAEELTPLTMAKRCEADDAVINLLTPSVGTSRQSGDGRVYVKSDGYCDFCFAVSCS